MILSGDRSITQFQQEFMGLINKHERILYALLYKRPFILRHEYDDYLQEMIMAAWKQFYTWEDWKDKIAFSTWLTVRAVGAITSYSRSLKNCFKVENKYVSRYMLYENMTLFDLPDDVDERNPHIDGLLMAINDLSDEDQLALYKYIKFKETGILLKMAIAEGKQPKWYSVKFQHIKKIIIAKKDRYFEGIIVSESKMAIAKKGSISSSRRAVEQIDLITGKVIREWESMDEAEKNGYNASHIIAVCRMRRTHHQGYIWRYCSN